jgi:hypothetical protein
MLHFFGHVTTCILPLLKLMVKVKSTHHPQDAKHAGKERLVVVTVLLLRLCRDWPEMKGGGTVDTDSLLGIAPVYGTISSFSSLIG